MVEGGGDGAAFPVVFFDGEREMNIGDVKINPALEYKPFQLMVSRKIGISPNQISIYLVDRKKKPKSPFSEDRRRIPITGKVNFGSLCRQKECCFLVILKRSRKSKNRRDRMINGFGFANFSLENGFPPPPVHLMTENLILLQRNQPTPFYDEITPTELDDLTHRLKRYDLNGRLRSLRGHREKYQMAMAKQYMDSPIFGSDHDLDPNPIVDSFPTNHDSYHVDSTLLVLTENEREKAFCEECWNAEKKGDTTPFHPCVNDRRSYHLASEPVVTCAYFDQMAKNTSRMDTMETQLVELAQNQSTFQATMHKQFEEMTM
ncbi:hypothetical protein DH2020_039782 [Rehmannia glutinosa]|uniref:DUF7138 domain-containing protein n=1 Tax=Rehmannia glutinosa TaxID=99300 RepID=A0ABR0UWI7_REHGL